MQVNQTLKCDSIEVKNITQRKVFILGGTGSGKTTTLKLLALNSPVPAYVFDPLNIIHIKGFQRVGITRTMIPKAANAGVMFNKLNVKKGVIFSFKNMLQKEIVEFCDGFFAYWKPHDCLIFFDEVHEVTPEGSGVYSHEVERTWRHGRNSNIGFIADSQRPALVDKNVLALTDFLIAYRTTWEHDLRAIDSVLANSMKKEQREILIEKLQAGEFLHGLSFDFQPNIYEIRPIIKHDDTAKSASVSLKSA